LLLGPIFTTLPRPEYFTSTGFYEYFWNIVGHIKFFLPQVFDGNPVGDVNISLWTVPYELECYLALMLLWGVRLLQKRGLLLVVIAIAIAFYTRRQFSGYSEIAAIKGIAPRALIIAFLCGLAISLYSDKIRLSIPIALTMLAGMIATTLDYRTVFIAPIFAAYLVVFLGMMHPPKKSFLLKGDYSYGLYLFAYPIQQCYTHLFASHREWYLNAAFTFVFGLAYAAFSWWIIEKPILGKKKPIVAAAERLVNSITGKSRR
jgi:peptidoglycan/LPS O-acetylase OafA/YrhL